MEFAWQQSRTEALYVELESKQIWGYITWKDDNRLNLEAVYCGPYRTGDYKSIGRFFGESDAKSAVERYCAEMAEKLKTAENPNIQELADKLAEGLGKQVVKK
jgi:hypothetical protein